MYIHSFQLRNTIYEFIITNNIMEESLTIAQILVLGKTLLKNRGIDSFVLDANVLLCYSLNCSPEDLLRDALKVIDKANIEKYKSLLVRRYNYEPVAYIIGKKEFYSQDFIVNDSTLIPRPDSEILVESVIKYIKNNVRKRVNILDLGTGSGCLLLSILANTEDSFGFGVDIQQKAINTAILNASNLGLAKRVKFDITDWVSMVDGEYDIIISNPPYISIADISCLDPSVVKYEPIKALDGGDDGLACYRQLAPIIGRNLKPEGIFFLECGIGQHNDVSDIMAEHGFKLLGFEHDLAGVNRCLKFTNGTA